MQNGKNNLNFLEAESVALNKAYRQFFGDGQPVGIAYTFITDRKNGNEWSPEEKEVAKKISHSAIKQLKDKELTKLITSGIVPDCLMARRYMATGTGMGADGRI